MDKKVNAAMASQLKLVSIRPAPIVHTRPIETRYFHVLGHGRGNPDRKARSTSVDNALCAIVRKMLADFRIQQADVYDLRGFICKRVTRTATGFLIKSVI